MCRGFRGEASSTPVCLWRAGHATRRAIPTRGLCQRWVGHGWSSTGRHCGCYSRCVELSSARRCVPHRRVHCLMCAIGAYGSVISCSLEGVVGPGDVILEASLVLVKSTGKGINPLGATWKSDSGTGPASVMFEMVRPRDCLSPACQCSAATRTARCLCACRAPSSGYRRCFRRRTMRSQRN
jgi:hypothetical protein